MNTKQEQESVYFWVPLRAEGYGAILESDLPYILTAFRSALTERGLEKYSVDIEDELWLSPECKRRYCDLYHRWYQVLDGCGVSLGDDFFCEVLDSVTIPESVYFWLPLQADKYGNILESDLPNILTAFRAALAARGLRKYLVEPEYELWLSPECETRYCDDSNNWFQELEVCGISLGNDFFCEVLGSVFKDEKVT